MGNDRVGRNSYTRVGQSQGLERMCRSVYRDACRQHTHFGNQGVGRSLGLASSRVQIIQFGVARLGRLRDQVADQNGGSARVLPHRTRHSASHCRLASP